MDDGISDSGHFPDDVSDDGVSFDSSAAPGGILRASDYVTARTEQDSNATPLQGNLKSVGFDSFDDNPRPSGFEEKDEDEKLNDELDLVESGESKAYDLSGAYDLGLPIVSDDDATSNTQPRSGSTDAILLKWAKEREWNSAKIFLTNSSIDHERKRAAIFCCNEDGETPLHICCRKKPPVEIVKIICEIGGASCVLLTNSQGSSTALHHACHFHACAAVIKVLVHCGGAEVCNKCDDIGNLPLHWALSKRASLMSVQILINIGGFGTIQVQNRIGWSALHTACYFDADPSVIKFLVSLGGSSLCKLLDKKHRTCLDLTYERNPFSVDSICLVLSKLGEHDECTLYLPECTFDSTLEWLKVQPDEVRKRALGTELMQRYLNQTFISRKYLTVMMIDLAFQITLVAVFSYGCNFAFQNYGRTISFSSAFALYFAICWFLVRELIQIVTTPVRAFVSEIKNWFDLAQIILVFWSLDILYFGGGVQTRAQVKLITLTAGFVWINLVPVLGKFFWPIRIFIIAFERTLFNLLPAVVTIVCILFGFAHMYYITNNFLFGFCNEPETMEYDEDYTCTIRSSYFMTFSQFFTMNWRFMERPSASAATVLSFTLAFLTTFLLLNVLVAQVVYQYSKFMDEGRRSFWTLRLTTILEISTFWDLFGCCCVQTKFHQSNSQRWKIGAVQENQPLTRFNFSNGEKYPSFPDDDSKVREWWLGHSERVPTREARISYFFKWATFSDIFSPGRDMERCLAGSKKDDENVLIRIGLYLAFPFIIAFIALVFVLGLGTFGLLWPPFIKKFLFYGKVNKYGSVSGSDSVSAFKEEVEDRSSTHAVVNAIQNEVHAESYAVKSMQVELRVMRKTLDEIRKAVGSSSTASRSEVSTTGSLSESNSFESEFA